MSFYKHQHEITNLIERYSGQDGVHETAIPALFLIRRSDITELKHMVYRPSLCFVVQGMKESFLAQERINYGAGDYLVTSVELPVSGKITEASTDVPYLALMLEFTPSQILEVLRDSDITTRPKEGTKRAMFASRIELTLLDAVIRLASLLDNPEDIPVLAPIFTKEILYKVLKGEHGVVLEQMAIEGSSTSQVRDVIEYIMNNYNSSFRIEELAKIANMSVSSLHKHFKEVTAMSPIQFQKQLRLQEARRLLSSESADATEVAFRVGYESPSQFSREYSRMFGLPPIEDLKRMRTKYDQALYV